MFDKEAVAEESKDEMVSPRSLGKLRESSPIFRITSTNSLATSADGPEFSSEDEYSSIT